MAATPLPHWDLTVVFPSLDSPEFAAGFEAVVTGTERLAALFDERHVAAQPPAPYDAQQRETFELAAAQLNDLLDRLSTLGAYIGGFVATNSRDELAQAKQSELRRHNVQLSNLDTRFTAWIGSLDVEALIARSAPARDHAYMLRKTKAEAEHLMSPAEEMLAAELSLSGGSAWSKLYNTYTSQLLVPIELRGTQQELPMPAIRNLAYDGDREVRRRGYEAELAAWQRAAVPIAAALNSLKGELQSLSARRHWQSPLDMALFYNNIDRPTLDAMLGAARESFPDFRRYLRAKARALALPAIAGERPQPDHTATGGTAAPALAGERQLTEQAAAGGTEGPALAWYDLFAPVGQGAREWSFEEGRQFIFEQFGSFSPKLRGLAERAFSERWIDAEPRAGKAGGAFCMRLRGGESRILANFKPSFGEVSTLAHELGHAYHNLNLAGRTMLQRSMPMTLAETASTFCQTIAQNAALQTVEAGEQLLILEAALQDACQVVVDISSRFLFEQSVFERRKQRDLSVEEFKQLMLDAQLATYGDGLDPAALHPYMWAAKGHYYGPTFYNYPYMFGLLFGLGLYARYQAEPEAFKAGYDELLSLTGMADAAELAARFGIDLRSSDFWRSSLAVIRNDIDRFEGLTIG